jgi:hypothetical protein
MNTKIILCLGLFVLALSACSSPAKKCPKPEKVVENNTAEFDPGPVADQATINMDSYDAVQYWKKKMNGRLVAIKKIYEKIDWNSPAYKKRFYDNLAASQKAFDAYLKAQVELQYPKAEEDEWWGSGIPPCINLIYLKHYKNRYNELALWEKGTPDGEMCGGSALTAYELEELGR